ncbi:hypothetical protein H4V95_000230 [Arthrobacter sp. CAN_C5]|nr:hypothetical protein [Arthrobacter sp. CAN_C5]
MTNPLVPDAWEIFSLVLGSSVIFLILWAIISIAHSRHISLTLQLLWVALVVSAPLIGSVIWFIYRAGRPTHVAFDPSPTPTLGRSKSAPLA